MSLKAIIVDDEKLAIEALKSVTRHVNGLEIVETYTNPQEALHNMEKDSAVDIIFLDIEMGASHGVEIARKLKEQYQETKIVFVTAHAEYAVDAFSVRAFDYLLKPVRQERLQKTIDRIREENDQANGPKEKNELSLTAYVMGNFQLYKNKTKEIRWRTKKVKELFAYIWHHYPEPVSRSRIMEDIWGEQHGDSAVQLMHTSFYHLRKAIRDSGFQNPVQFINEQYVLNLPIQSDLGQLETVMEKQSLKEADIEKMLKLYKANYLEGENYDWAWPKQQQLKSSFLTKLEHYVVQQMDKQKFSHLVETSLDYMVCLDPYNERYIYLLIDYHGQARNLQKMIKAAGHFEDLWTKELGISIPKEISSLYYKYITGSTRKE